MNGRDPSSAPFSYSSNINDRINSSYNNTNHHHHEKDGPSQSESAGLTSLQTPLEATLSDLQEERRAAVHSTKFLPPNWPAHVKYLVDYEYHSSIDQSTLDLVQGRRKGDADHPEKTKNGAGSSSDLRLLVNEGGYEEEEEEGTTIVTDDGDEEEHEGTTIVTDDGDEEEHEGTTIITDDGDEEEHEGTTIVTDDRDEEEQEYDKIPIGHAIPGLVFTADSKATTSEGSAEPLYEVRYIDSPDHPVFGSYGLFALKTLRPGLHLLDYISLVVPDEFADPDSDHTLYLCNDLNLDASVHGNHGRFVNDFRGIRTQEQGPNVGWDLYRDADTGQVRMGCKVLKRIRKGEEILCTYGHGYWKSRGLKVEGEEWEDGWDTDLDDVGSSSSSGESDSGDYEAEEVKGEFSGKDFEDTFRPPRQED